VQRKKGHFEKKFVRAIQTFSEEKIETMWDLLLIRVFA
jgi:hypothetical protein